MGFFDNVGADLLYAFKTDVVNSLPILKDNESYLSDIDLYLSVINAFDESKYFNKGIISDVAMVGSHLEFEYLGIPVAVFNMATRFTISSVNLPLAGQGILDMKEDEISEWNGSYESAPHILIILELGSTKNYPTNSNSFAYRANKTDDLRYIVSYFIN